MAWSTLVVTLSIIAQLTTGFNHGNLQDKSHLLEQSLKNLPRLPNGFLHQPNLNRVAPAIIQELIHSNRVDLFLEKLTRKIQTQEIGETCAADIDEFLTQLGQLTSADTWALHMVDAWGKLPSGILGGNLADPGDFFQCINLRGQVKDRTREVKGKYCTAYLIPTIGSDGNQNAKRERQSEIMDAISFDELVAMLSQDTVKLRPPSIGTCFPASCSQQEIQAALNDLFKVTDGTVVPFIAFPCTTADKPDLDGGDYAMITLLGVIAGLCILATVVDIATYRIKEEGSKPMDRGLPVKLLLAFSLYTNTRKWLDTRAGSDDLGCLHGLRFLSLSWVVLCHTFEMVGFQPIANQFDALSWYKDWSYYPMLNGTVSVDTFFVISGALLAYNLLRELNKTGGRFNYPLLVLHRYLRLTPTYMFIVGMTATIAPHMSTGPTWYIMDSMSDGCAHNWWHNMLYVNNLLNYTGKAHEECYGESWYLCNDMQFFLLAPLVIYILWKWTKIGYGLLALLSLIPIISVPVIMDKKYEPPTLLIFSDEGNAYNDIYTKPWARCDTYIAGLVLGYVLYLRKKNPKSFQNIPSLFIAIGWILNTAIALAIIFGPMHLFYPENVNLSKTAWYSFMYGALHRPAWGVVISWIIFTCVNGNGGLVNDFLSWKAFVPLGRLVFCMYISSYHMQLAYSFRVVRPVHVSGFELMYSYFAHMVSAGILGYVLMITLESPFIQLEKLILPAKSRQLPPPVKVPEVDANGNEPAAATAISV